MAVSLHADRCECPPEWCAHFVDPPEDCIGRLEGEVVTKECPNHIGSTWHQNGECLKCKRNG